MYNDAIFGLIDEYCAWYAERYPLVGGTRKALLYRFARSFKIKCVGDINEEQIAFFIGEELTAFYAETALKAIRNFLWYSVMTGHKCISYKMATQENLKRTAGRPRNNELAKEVQTLRTGKTPLSYRAIKKNLDDKYKKSFSLKNLHLWGNYELQ